ncbi:MAG: helicase-related protein [Myxococcota bacterium]|nr:helicase-related protein [Myxococcota bacterium]
MPPKRAAPNFISLLDPFAFRNEDVIRDLIQQPKSPWFLRRMKEDLRDFAGKLLFVDRHAATETFHLTEVEYSLYTAVSRYINTFLPRQKGRRKATAALARMVLQRRLSSSLRAIRTSLERRLDKVTGTVEKLEELPAEARAQELRKLVNLPVDPETASDDEADEALDEAAESTILAEHFDKLKAELPELRRLVEQARSAEAKSREKGHESKLQTLFRCLDKAQFAELKERSGKLLIFTEHRATLEYLEEHLTKAGYSCCHIHGGMDAVARKEAQRQFQSEKQICIATEAAGEGINLQFCHLMINYDIPWNPNRLDQRMGRIHRFGQTRDVYVFNFVAVSGPKGPDDQPVVEGRILERLFQKIEEIKETLGDRVFDMIGLLLQRNNVALEEMLREAAYNPRMLDDYTDRIARMSPEKVQEYERSTGIALAKSTVDLGRIRGQDFASEEKRLMPEFVEGFFLDGAKKTGLRVERRANPNLLRIEHVPQKFLARDLAAVRARGAAEQRYLKATFHKADLAKVDNLDGCLLSPGHPLYAALDEVLRRDLRNVEQGTARYLDPFAIDPYRLHFFEVEIEGESLGDPGQPARTVPVHAELVAVQENAGDVLSQAQPDVLHDLTPVDPSKLFPPTEPWSGPPTPEEIRKITLWLRATHQHATVGRLQHDRQREVEIRREFLVRAFDTSIKAARAQWGDLAARVAAGESEAKLARDEKLRYVEEIEMAAKHRLDALKHLAVVRSGRIGHLGSALVAPAPAPAAAAMQRDDAVEQAAIDVAIAYEQRRGWEVDEVWKRHDGSGFDLRSVSPADAAGRRDVRRIEVKGRAADGVEVHLSPNEWRQAQRLRDTYWLYVVWGAKGQNPKLKAIRDPWETFREQAHEVVEVKGYRIAGDALRAVTGEEWTT